MNRATVQATPAQPERRTKPRTAHCCTANHCAQGRKPCPCPQACELPTANDPLQDAPVTRTDIAKFMAVVLGAVLCLLAILAASA